MEEFYRFSRSYVIRRDGQLSKRCEKSAEGSMNIRAVTCEKCGTVWESSDTFCCDEKVFIRMEGVKK